MDSFLFIYSTACLENIVQHAFFFFFGNARCELGADKALVALDIGQLDLVDVSVCARCGGRGVDGVF